MDTKTELQGTLNNAIRAKQRFISNVLTSKADNIYDVNDFKSVRKSLFNNVKDAVINRFPLYNDRYVLSIENVDYDDPEDIPIEAQKKAILEGTSCNRRLRGNWVLRDAATDKVVSKTNRTTLMKVPYMTDRGSFIRNGHEYVFINIMRLEPGVYTKSKGDEISAQFNIKKGTGSGFKMYLQPNTGIFRIIKGTLNSPAYTVFKDMGISDEAMEQAWGKDLFLKNKEAGSGEKARIAADKIYGVRNG